MESGKHISLFGAEEQEIREIDIIDECALGQRNQELFFVLSFFLNGFFNYCAPSVSRLKILLFWLEKTIERVKSAIMPSFYCLIYDYGAMGNVYCIGVDERLRDVVAELQSNTKRIEQEVFRLQVVRLREDQIINLIEQNSVSRIVGRGDQSEHERFDILRNNDFYYFRKMAALNEYCPEQYVKKLRTEWCT